MGLVIPDTSAAWEQLHVNCNGFMPGRKLTKLPTLLAVVEVLTAELLLLDALQQPVPWEIRAAHALRRQLLLCVRCQAGHLRPSVAYAAMSIFPVAPGRQTDSASRWPCLHGAWGVGVVDIVGWT